MFALQKFAAELIGTFILCFVVLVTGDFLAIGSTLALLVLVIAPISGGPFNPAVAIAFLTAGKISYADILPYVLAEIAGALIAVELSKDVRFRK